MTSAYFQRGEIICLARVCLRDGGISNVGDPPSHPKADVVLRLSSPSFPSPVRLSAVRQRDLTSIQILNNHNPLDETPPSPLSPCSLSSGSAGFLSKRLPARLTGHICLCCDTWCQWSLSGGRLILTQMEMSRGYPPLTPTLPSSPPPTPSEYQ